MRADIYPSNQERIIRAIQQIREQTGMEVSFNRVLNLYLESIDSVEFMQIVTIRLREFPDTGREEIPRARRKKVIKKTTNWATNV